MIDRRMHIFEKKNVLVTGGAGFIGSHLCERLLRDAKVICLDDLSSGSISNMEHLLQYPDFEFIKCDINRPIDLDDFAELSRFKVAFQGVQEIYHLACPTSPSESGEGRVRVLRSNADGVLSTLDLAARYRASYVLASSSVVYGPAATGRDGFREEDEGLVDHLSARSAYNEGKRFAETCVATYRDAYHIDVKIARIFPTYGPRMRLRMGFLVPDFIDAALDGEDLLVYGDEDAPQSFCYVTDMADGLVRLARSSPGLFICNLGSDQPVSLRALAETIVSYAGSGSRALSAEPAGYVLPRGAPDISRAKSELSWLPLVPLSEGLRKTMDYIIAKR